MAADGIVNLAVVMKDTVTEERVLEIQEFNLSSPKIDVEVQILASGVVFLLFFLDQIITSSASSSLLLLYL